LASSAHGRLKHQVQAIEPDRERHLDPALHRRFDVVEGDFEARDAVGGHAARLRRSSFRAQFHGSSSCSRDTGWSAIRRRTSASQARGSTSLSLAVYADRRTMPSGATFAPQLL